MAQLALTTEVETPDALVQRQPVGGGKGVRWYYPLDPAHREVNIEAVHPPERLWAGEVQVAAVRQAVDVGRILKSLA